MRLSPRLVVIFFLLAGGLILAACGGSGASDAPSASAAALPEWVRDAPARVREAYQYAAYNPDELRKYPCYCGCGAMGHTSNLSCYVQDIAPDGTITFDNHASGCGICVDITQDVKRLKAQGQSSPQVRAYIDAQYSSFGPGTNTPLPTE
jgi:hypothetical protein